MDKKKKRNKKSNVYENCAGCRKIGLCYKHFHEIRALMKNVT